MEKDKSIENIEDEQVVEFVDELDEKIMSVIYQLYDNILISFLQIFAYL